jgi:predicted ATPase
MADLDLDAAFIPALHKPAALLPIAKHRESLLYVIEKYPVTIVIGQTGSGKTTQIPQFLERAGWCSDGKIIGVTQVNKHKTMTPHKLTFSSLVVSQLPQLRCGSPKKSAVSLAKKSDIRYVSRM